MTLDDHDFVAGPGVTGLGFLKQRNVALARQLAEHEAVVGEVFGKRFHGDDSTKPLHKEGLG